MTTQIFSFSSLDTKQDGVVPHPLRVIPNQIGYNSPMKRKILVVDDTRNVLVLLSDFLESQDFEVLTASDGRQALEVVEASNPDMILLDIMMPNMDGYQFISHLRRTSSIPVIMITAKQQEADVVRGFELGADDYIIKPFRMRELLMRMRAVLRRAAPKEGSDPCLAIQDISLDPSKHEVKQSDQLIELTPLEFQVLEMLMQSAGKVVRRADLCMRLMENGYMGSEATLKIHIRNLRMKLKDDPNQPRYIETVLGLGYRFLEGVE
jgi:DNA-binding response OmpR family regulator